MESQVTERIALRISKKARAFIEAEASAVAATLSGRIRKIIQEHIDSKSKPSDKPNQG